MPRPTKGPRLGSGPAHEKALLRTLAEQLFENGKVRTTEAKARRLRPFAEKLILLSLKLISPPPLNLPLMSMPVLMPPL
ncbi:MAG: hypothetical protein EBZ85_02635 [Actinobacteria bacterium]|nr:hypothetical protein [Actinomycetota bacterium]